MSTKLSKENRDHLVLMLRGILSDMMLVSVKALNYHWNVTGMHFGPLHTLFQEHYKNLVESADNVAERIKALRDYAPGSFKEFSELTIIEEATKQQNDRAMLRDMATDYTKIISRLEKGIDLADKAKDKATEDLLVGILGQHEKNLWILDAHLGG